ncbi:MAG TPA: hypothetical protein VGR40_05955 [Candidatus Binatus sp.]|nr:hypothetical protein [Candidatus Binatus sp.]
MRPPHFLYCLGTVPFANVGNSNLFFGLVLMKPTRATSYPVSAIGAIYQGPEAKIFPANRFDKGNLQRTGDLPSQAVSDNDKRERLACIANDIR